MFYVCNFGIVEHEFARQLQTLASASATVSAAEHKPQGTMQVQVQGNATAEVAKLLTGQCNGENMHTLFHSMIEAKLDRKLVEGSVSRSERRK